MDLFELVELRPVLGDGAMGTMLQQRGLREGDCPEAWNIDRPGVVQDIHRAYYEAGSDFVETNTFGASTIKLGRYGLDGKIEPIIRGAIGLARKGVGATCMIAGSVGPTGVLLEPYGDYSREQVEDAFRATAQIMESSGVDFYIVETMTDLNEALLAVSAIKDVSNKPIVVTMVFAKGAKGYRTMMGTSPQEAASALAEAGADFLGTNCCSGAQEALEIMSGMAEATPLAVVAQPNAGLPRIEEGKPVYPETPDDMAAGMERLLAGGMRIVGGCCGTTPTHIKAMGSIIGKC